MNVDAKLLVFAQNTQCVVAPHTAHCEVMEKTVSIIRKVGGTKL